MSSIENITRRGFLVGAGAGAAGGLVLGVWLSRRGKDDRVAPTGPSTAFWPNIFVAIATNGTVTIVCHRSEMGQQIRTAVAQIIADELDADWSKVVVAQAEGDEKYGDQNTDGSRSVRRNLLRLRQAGASARTMLEQAAAARLGVPASECHAENNHIVHGSGQTIEFGELAEAAAVLEPPPVEGLKLKDRANWQYINKPTPSVDAKELVTGSGIFGIDVQLTGMRIAVIERPPVLFGKPKSVDNTAALAVPGVEKVIELPVLTPPAAFKPLGGVAVIATNTWAALQGRRALKIEWDNGPNASYSSNPYREQLLQTAAKKGRVVRDEGNVTRALRDAHEVLEADYYVPHLAQAPMEPPAATAHVTEEGAVVWSSTQAPQATRAEVARAVGLDESDVQVHVTLLGGGFGRKAKPDFAAEAALLSRDVGAPVKVMWTREDDLHNGYPNSVAAQHLEAGLDADGRTTAWLQRTVFPPIAATFRQGTEYASSFDLGQGLTDNPFSVPNMRLENGAAEAHMRIGWLRSVANVYHAFATQSFVAELAEAAGRDPKDYLLELIGPPRKVDLATLGVDYPNYGDPIETYPVDTARLSNVVRLAASMAQWGRKPSSGRGLGIAAHRSFLAYVATVVEVEVSKQGDLTIPAVWVAIDAGTIVNPDTVRAQCEGGSVYGLSCALGEITATDGAVDQSNFDTYRVARMQEAPKSIEVKIVDSTEPPCGVGEPPTPTFAPALCNAIYQATGKRIRALPIGDQLRT